MNARNECPAQSLSSGLPDAEIRNSQGEDVKSYRGGKRDGGKGKPRALSRFRTRKPTPGPESVPDMSPRQSAFCRVCTRLTTRSEMAIPWHTW